MTAACAPRGMFARIAEELQCDPSHVSRVYHGKHQSKRVSDAIAKHLKAAAKGKANGRKR